jgi:hypothetical protein
VFMVPSLTAILELGNVISRLAHRDPIATVAGGNELQLPSRSWPPISLHAASSFVLSA